MLRTWQVVAAARGGGTQCGAGALAAHARHKAAAAAGQAEQAAGGGHACHSCAEDRGPGRNAHGPRGPRGSAVMVRSGVAQGDGPGAWNLRGRVGRSCCKQEERACMVSSPEKKEKGWGNNETGTDS